MLFCGSILTGFLVITDIHIQNCGPVSEAADLTFDGYARNFTPALGGARVSHTAASTQAICTGDDKDTFSHIAGDE